MDIGEDVAGGLRPFASSSSSSATAHDATVSNLQALAEAAIQVILQRLTEESALSSPSLDAIQDIHLIKRTYSALVCIYLEAARRDLSSSQFRTYLTTNCGLADSASTPLCDLLSQHKHDLREALSRTANHSYIRRLIGVDWRLDYCVSASEDKDMKELLYFVGLKTSESMVEMACTVEQLQDMVAQLKDACKAAERASKPN